MVPTQIYAKSPQLLTSSIYGSTCKAHDRVPEHRISSSTQLLYENFQKEAIFSEQPFEKYPQTESLRNLISFLKPPKLDDDIR